MKQSVLRARAGAAVALLLATACTMKEQEPPALSGPSEFAQSITITLTPDVIQQDGASQSVVTVTARGPNGAPLANLPLRAEIRVDDVPTDFGTISARNLVTNSDGRATLVYTAPPPIAGLAESTTVAIGITPLGNDFGNAVTRFASLRLVPTGSVVSPANIEVQIAASPDSPADNEPVVLTATACARRSNPGDPCVTPASSIVSYTWDFGDGTSGTGQIVTHAFPRPGTFSVRVRATDAQGRSASASTSITVAAGVGPTAVFNFSPASPFAGESTFFNASASTAAPGRRITSYRWVFGDGGTSSEGPTTSHVYASPGTYNVTLTVTDDAGRTQTSSPQAVTVARRP